MAQIEIEQMLFGDYRVCVWDENLNSLLDRTYFCRGYESAASTAFQVQYDMFPELPIYLRSMSEGDIVMKLTLMADALQK